MMAWLHEPRLGCLSTSTACTPIGSVSKWYGGALKTCERYLGMSGPSAVSIGECNVQCVVRGGSRFPSTSLALLRISSMKSRSSTLSDLHRCSN